MAWKADTDCRDISGTRRQPEIVDETGRVIAVLREWAPIYTADGDLDEAAMAAAEDRTARLMAASEQMLAALKQVVKDLSTPYLPQSDNDFAILKRAIRAAEGGGE